MMNDVALIADDVPVACSLTAGERVTRAEEINDLFTGVQQVRELADGYALCFPGTSSWPQRVLDFIQGERSCCLFFTFEVAFLPNQGPIWLNIRGPEGTKEMVRETLASREITLDKSS
ncbi:MAG TPA: hypothetical protein VGT44_13000 [Ktedonobacteraceae bacterium]|nr:hypothetical protein [Ktedonobacteraceae bacterium]